MKSALSHCQVNVLEEVGTSWEVGAIAWVRNDETQAKAEGMRMWGTSLAASVFLKLGSRLALVSGC